MTKRPNPVVRTANTVLSGAIDSLESLQRRLVSRPGMPMSDVATVSVYTLPDDAGNHLKFNFDRELSSETYWTGGVGYKDGKFTRFPHEKEAPDNINALAGELLNIYGVEDVHIKNSELGLRLGDQFDGATIEPLALRVVKQFLGVKAIVVAGRYEQHYSNQVCRHGLNGDQVPVS